MALAEQHLDDKPAGIGEDEWEQRCKLAAVYRIFARMGLDDLIYTHISARVPGPDEHFLINPFGLMYEEVSASNLVKIDLDGNAVDDSPHTVNYAGFVIHGAVHKARPDLHCVIHLHTDAGCAVAAHKDGLLPLSQHSLFSYGPVAYHDYEGLALDLGEQERLVADLGDSRWMILRNHGTLAVGGTVGEAFFHMYNLEKACRIQAGAMSAGLENVSQAPADVVAKVAAQRGGSAAAQRGRNTTGIGELELAAWMRKLDRDGEQYRH